MKIFLGFIPSFSFEFDPVLFVLERVGGENYSSVQSLALEMNHYR